MYILSENKKYILSEKFILNEVAHDTLDAQQAEKLVTELLNNIIQLKPPIEKNVEQLKKQLKELQAIDPKSIPASPHSSSNNATLDLNKVLPELENKYSTELIPLINKTENILTEKIKNKDFEEILKDLRLNIKSAFLDKSNDIFFNNLKATATKLKNASAGLEKMQAEQVLDTILTSIKAEQQVQTTNNARGSHVKQHKINKQIANIQASQKFKTQDDIMKAVDTVISQFKKFNTILQSVKTSCSKIHKTAASINNKTATKNWAERFNNSAKTDPSGQQLKELWTEYYAAEWGADADKVANLGLTFQQELLNLGFIASANPFITFVKNNINKLDLTSKNYPAIHNAYVKNYISKQDLLGETVASDFGSIGKANLIFNTELYKISSATQILNYLDIQYKILNYFSQGSAQRVLKPELVDTYVESEPNAAQFNTNIFSSKLDPLKRTKVANVVAMANKMTLRTIENVKALWQNCIRSSETADLAPSKQNFNSSAFSELVAKLGTKNNVTNAIKYLATLYGEDITKNTTITDTMFDTKFAPKLYALTKNYNLNNQNVKKAIEYLAKSIQVYKEK